MAGQPVLKKKFKSMGKGAFPSECPVPIYGETIKEIKMPEKCCVCDGTEIGEVK